MFSKQMLRQSGDIYLCRCNNKMLKLVDIQPSTRKDKKLMALFSDGKTVHFGSEGYEDYTTHKDNKRKELYLTRHSPRENWNDPQTPGALSRWVLWNKSSLESSIKDYKKRFNL